ncbi:hypothetical protein TNCV_4003031 [Trichonephila clavipes]|nr:hypothetical protein TNCV_4003031 [Trichonephila clavipes]
MHYQGWCIVQNKTLAFATDAATSTPIAAMKLRTESSGPFKSRQYSDLSLEIRSDKYRQRRTSALKDLVVDKFWSSLFDSQRRDQLLPYVG